MSKTITLNTLSKFGNRINMIRKKRRKFLSSLVVKISNGLKALWILEEHVNFIQ